MKAFKKRLYWFITLITIFVFLLIIIWRLALGYTDFQGVLLFIGENLLPTILYALVFSITYNLIIERILCWKGRRVSAKHIHDDIPQFLQVDGELRAGKDASTTGECIILRDELIRRYKKELRTLVQKMYLYDLRKLHEHIKTHYKDYFVASKKQFKKVFTKHLKANSAFISIYYINKKKIDPTKHINSWIHRKGKQVPDVPFKDGITIGGKHMLDLLERYIKVYIRIQFIPEFIMSNQPIIEQSNVKKNGFIKTLFSKIFSVDYISLKQKTAMPFVLGMIIYETETAILYANTDKELEEFIKNVSGIKENLTVGGHIYEEEVWMRAVTQDKDRPNKTLRELYQGYAHVFKFEYAATHDIYRLNFTIRRWIHMIHMFFLKLLNAHIIGTSYHKRLLNNMYYFRERRVSILHQKDLNVWSKGYLIFYKGIYKKIQDSGKTVKFPILWGMREMKTKNSSYKMWGFKQFNKITDSFGRYNTHMMNTVREAKTQIYDMHFTDVENYSGLSQNIDEMSNMKYMTVDKMNSATIEHRLLQEKEVKNNRKKILKAQKRTKNYDLQVLTTKELHNLCVSYGSDIVSLTTPIKMKFIELINTTIDDEKWNTSGIEKLTVKELLNLSRDYGCASDKVQDLLNEYRDEYIRELTIKLNQHHVK